MGRSYRNKNKLLSISFAAILTTCLVANLFITSVFADEAGDALRFDGTSDFVELKSTTSTFAPTWVTTKSVSLWVKPDGWQTNCIPTPSGYDVSECDSIFGDRPKWWGIAIGYLDGPNQNRIWVWNHDDSVDSPNDFVGVEYTPGQWVHITLVHNNGMLRAYKNGIEVGSTPSGPTIQPGGGGNILHLGGVITNSIRYWLFQGEIDEVSLWNRALSSAEIQANMYVNMPANTNDLAAFYRMSNGSGISLTDDHGTSCGGPPGCTGTLNDGIIGVVPPSNGPPQWVTSTAFDVDGPTVTINKAVGQADPTTFSPINFTVEFGDNVTGFETGDVTLSGTAGATTAIVTGSNRIYNVAVSGMTNTGTVIARVNTGVARDSLGRLNQPSTSTDNEVQFNTSSQGPTVTIRLATGQASPTSTSPINFTVQFSENVTGLVTGDVSLSGGAGATTAVVTGSGNIYNVAVSGMSRSGTVIASIPPGVAQDASNFPNQASTPGTGGNIVNYEDNSGPTVTINQAPGQSDPASTLPIHFQVIFSEVVEDFRTTVVTLTGTASGPRIVAINGSGTTYDVAVSGLTGMGTVIATIPAGVVHDASGNNNFASTFSDNSILYAKSIVYLPITVR